MKDDKTRATLVVPYRPLVTQSEHALHDWFMTLGAALP